MFFIPLEVRKEGSNFRPSVALLIYEKIFKLRESRNVHRKEVAVHNFLLPQYFQGKNNLFRTLKSFFFNVIFFPLRTFKTTRKHNKIN